MAHDGLPDREALLEWYAAVRRPLPWRASRDPYALLVSEVMLQQTQAARVVPYYEAFLARFPDAAALASAPARDVLAHWSGLGYNRRALALQAAARIVARDGWPEDLRTLPGVGPYTAAALGAFAWDRDEAAVDTNVRRVIERWDGALRTPRALAERAAQWLPRGRAADFNQAMMELGATVCAPRAARCAQCPLANGCAGAAVPSRLPRTALRRRRERFEDTDRWARGRVVAALLAGQPLPAAVHGERRERVLAALERDGLIRRGPGGSVALP
ncbi:MAG: A/G-specific adenine glycosylase [Solirubrobacteraceae bacterium]|jgi:A/G-specific adenine glycosylase|nr:A/G-specific adenine glycosylase [Solirubrobacteraceae bacterium]